MRERPIRDICQFCDQALFHHPGITTFIQPYMEPYWPAWAPPFDQFVGDAHLWCLQQAGLAEAWNACSVRHSVEVAGTRPIIEVDEVFLGYRPYELHGDVQGVGFRIAHAAVRDVIETGIARTRTGSIVFDLYGQPQPVREWVRDAFATGPVDVDDVLDAVGLVRHPLPTPVTRAFLSGDDETFDALQNDELVGGGGYECRVPDVAIEALRRYLDDR